MKRPYGVYVNNLLMNRFLTRMGALKLIYWYLERGIKADMKMIGDVLENG